MRPCTSETKRSAVRSLDPRVRSPRRTIMNWYCGRARKSSSAARRLRRGERGGARGRTQAVKDAHWMTMPMQRTMLSTTIAFLRPRRSASLQGVRKSEHARLEKVEEERRDDARCADERAKERANGQHGDDQARAHSAELARLGVARLGALREAELEVVLREVEARSARRSRSCRVERARAPSRGSRQSDLRRPTRASQRLVVHLVLLEPRRRSSRTRVITACRGVGSVPRLFARLERAQKGRTRRGICRE